MPIYFDNSRTGGDANEHGCDFTLVKKKEKEKGRGWPKNKRRKKKETWGCDVTYFFQFISRTYFFQLLLLTLNSKKKG